MTALRNLYGFSSDDSLAAWVAKTFGLGATTASGNANRARRAAIAQRLRLYRDDAQQDFEMMIGAIFENPDVIKQRKAMLCVAKKQNVTARIVNEVASLYDSPASRRFVKKGDGEPLGLDEDPNLSPLDTSVTTSIINDDAETERYREMARDLELDEVMQEAHRLTFLCNETLLWRVKPPAEEGEPTDELHIITPDAFDAIPNPNRVLCAAGYLIDTAPISTSDLVDKTQLKSYELWDDRYVYALTVDGKLCTAKYCADALNPTGANPREHGFGRIPGVLLHKRKPVDRILDSRPGSDIVHGHLCTVLLEVMIMRLAKSQGERQPIIIGNTANVAAEQSMDGEKPIALPAEVTAMMLDTKTTPEHYLAAKEDGLQGLAGTYGISWAQFTNAEQGSNGRDFLVRRLKLTELRNEQRRRARVQERAIARLLGFDPCCLRVDHQEQAIPQDAVEEVELLDIKIRLGLDSAVAYLMRRDPDLSKDEALSQLKQNTAWRGIMVMMMRSLNLPAGGDPNAEPQINSSGKLVFKADPATLDGTGAPMVTAGAGGPGAAGGAAVKPTSAHT